jgi:cytochrome P450
MLNTLIYKKLTQSTSSRADLATDQKAGQRATFETFRDSTECTHLVGSMSACKAVLSDDENFAPSPIAEAVRTIGERFGLDVGAAYGFLSENPMQLSGDEHSSRRKQHLSHYASTLKRMSGAFQRTADKHLAAAVENPPHSIVEGIVEPYVDDLLQQVVSAFGVSPEAYRQVCRGNNILLEHVHHPRKLSEKSRQISAFPAHGQAQDKILLSYILQGRDPMIGGITAFLRSICDMPTSERSAALARTSAAGLFRLTSPVNYIGRIARRAITIEGIEIAPGDQLLLLLPSANGDPSAATDNRGVAFGAGHHTCAGQALALSITDTLLAALRSRHNDIDWSTFQPDTPVAAVFRHYKAQS